MGSPPYTIDVFSAVDPDPPQPGVILPSYSILEDDAEFIGGFWTYRNVQLSLSGRLRLLEMLDYEDEEQRNISFTVEVCDNAPPFPRSSVASVHILTIDANDNTPAIGSSLAALIPSGAGAGDAITYLSAVDFDSNTPRGGENNVILW